MKGSFQVPSTRLEQFCLAAKGRSGAASVFDVFQNHTTRRIAGGGEEYRRVLGKLNACRSAR